MNKRVRDVKHHRDFEQLWVFKFVLNTLDPKYCVWCHIAYGVTRFSCTTGHVHRHEYKSISDEINHHYNNHKNIPLVSTSKGHHSSLYIILYMKPLLLAPIRVNIFTSLFIIVYLPFISHHDTTATWQKINWGCLSDLPIACCSVIKSLLISSEVHIAMTGCHSSTCLGILHHEHKLTNPSII